MHSPYPTPLVDILHPEGYGHAGSRHLISDRDIDRLASAELVLHATAPTATRQDRRALRGVQRRLARAA